MTDRSGAPKTMKETPSRTKGIPEVFPLDPRATERENGASKQSPDRAADRPKRSRDGEKHTHTSFELEIQICSDLTDSATGAGWRLYSCQEQRCLRSSSSIRNALSPSQSSRWRWFNGKPTVLNRPVLNRRRLRRKGYGDLKKLRLPFDLATLSTLGSATELAQ